MSVLQGLPSLPEVPQLQYTAALTLAAYADWLADSLHAGHPANVPDLLQSLMRGTCKPSEFSTVMNHASSTGDG